MATIQVYLPSGQRHHERLREESRRTGKAMSLIVREALDAYTGGRGGKMDDYVPDGLAMLINLDLPDDTIRALAARLVSERPTKAHAVGGRAYLLASAIESEILKTRPKSDMVHADEVGYMAK